MKVQCAPLDSLEAELSEDEALLSQYCEDLQASQRTRTGEVLRYKRHRYSVGLDKTSEYCNTKLQFNNVEKWGK